MSRFAITNIWGGGYAHKERNSNLELLRILSMLAIVAHHSVVNSGITDCYDFANITANMIFLQLWGMWGKTAINVFVMITGYFMCTSKLTWKRFLKMWMEAKFYKVVIFIIFVFAGYETVTAWNIFKLMFSYVNGINNDFLSSFFAFYLFIPFMNVLIEKLDCSGLRKLITLLLGMFMISSTFFFNSTIYHYVFWFITLYFVAAYIRLYPNKWTESMKCSGIVLASAVALSYMSVLVIDFVGINSIITDAYYMVSDSNKLFAFVVGVAAFLFFKNISITNNKHINMIASTTFGVLCIHANSDAMRQWLWRDFLNLSSLYTGALSTIVLTYITVMIGVFCVCSIIDYLRIQLIEKPVFNAINKNTEKIEEAARQYKAIITLMAKKFLT